ncbi:MAG: sugar O-acetyltransferase [Candidatus Cyclobacteriaceae bacterium M3_2C_046]
MKTEKEKMLDGELYNASDPQLMAERRRARLLFQKLNASRDDEEVLRKQIISQLFGKTGKGLWIEPPFYCDYGSHIELGHDVFINFNCTMLDVNQLTIGDKVLIGPNVQIYTATHPLDWQERARGMELAKPVKIGSHVWIGGGAIIFPGITVGERSIIGAGSVVTKDVPADTLVGGNPCKVIREL